MLQACPNSNSEHAPRLQLTQISHECTQNTHTHTYPQKLTPTYSHRNKLQTHTHTYPQKLTPTYSHRNKVQTHTHTHQIAASKTMKSQGQSNAFDKDINANIHTFTIYFLLLC